MILKFKLVDGWAYVNAKEVVLEDKLVDKSNDCGSRNFSSDKSVKVSKLYCRASDNHAARSIIYDSGFLLNDKGSTISKI